MNGNLMPKPEPEDDFEDRNRKIDNSSLAQRAKTAMDYGQQKPHLVSGEVAIKTEQTERETMCRKRKADDEKQSGSDDAGAGRQKNAAVGGFLVPKLEKLTEENEIKKRKSMLTGNEGQKHDSVIKKEDDKPLLPVDIHEALLRHLVSTGFSVTNQQQLALVVKRFLDKRQVTISSFPNNQPSDEWMGSFLGQYRRRLLIVQKGLKKEIRRRQKMSLTNEQPAENNEKTKVESGRAAWPSNSAVKAVLSATVDRMVPNAVIVEKLDHSEEVTFVTKLIRADKHYATGLLPTLLKQYLDERKITVRSFRGNLPSAAYMNDFLLRHGTYLAAVIQQPVAPNSVAIKVAQEKTDNSQRKQQSFEGQQLLDKDGKLLVGSEEELLQSRYGARLNAAFRSHLAGELVTTFVTAKKFLVREDDLLKKIARDNYKTRLDKALKTVHSADHQTIMSTAARFSVHPESLVKRVHDRNRDNVTGDQGKFAFTQKMENAFVKMLEADGVAHERQELPSVLLAFFAKQGIKVPGNLLLEEWSKSFVLKHKKSLNHLIADLW